MIMVYMAHTFNAHWLFSKNTVRVPTFDMKLFAMQHCGFVQVTSPQELADEIRDELQAAVEKYGG